VAPALRTVFHDYEVAACGFSCQGPVLLQMLNLLEPYDFAALGHNAPKALHVMLEAMKLAFADREAYYGDPKHVKVPMDGLLSKVYAKARRALIHEERAWPEMPPAGDPYGLAAVKNGAPRTPPGPIGVSAALDTSYVAVVDEEGNAFSSTPSDPCVDSPVIPGVGCVVSPRGSQGWLAPGHPSEVAARQAAASHARAVDGLQERTSLHGLRHPRRRRPTAGHAAGVPERHRPRHAAAAGHRGAAARHALVPRLLLAASQRPRRGRGRAPRARRDAAGAGRAGPSGQRLAGVGLARGAQCAR
jgi:hypothetical protein